MSRRVSPIGNSSGTAATPPDDQGPGKAKKGPISCAECRRLKVKCDLPKLKSGPCSSCSKRGCGELCPDGSLRSGRGTRYILSGTEELHKQIEELRSQVRELEDALTSSKHSGTMDYHSRLRNEADRGQPANHGALPELDALMVSSTGRLQWLGTTALSEWFIQPKDKAPWRNSAEPTISATPQGAPTGNIIFSADTLTENQVKEYRQVAIAALPEPQTMERIVDLYYDQVAWFYNPLPRERLMHIVSRIYSGSSNEIESHELSCVHTVLAFGHLMDPREPADNPQVYHHAKLGRLCLHLECMFAQTTVATIEAYLLRLMFLLFDKDQTAPMKVYGQLGLVWSLIISMGMHRDPARWNFDASECQRRRRVFWEFVAFDTWQCLSWGRPSSIDVKSFDCEQPWRVDEHLDDEDRKFHRWKFIYIRDILRDVLALNTMCGIGPTIDDAMKLDTRIRGYENLEPVSTTQAAASVPVIYQRNIMFCIKESTLCFLHRPFFVSALNENLHDPLRSRFAGSCLAVHASASALLGRAPFVLDFQAQASRFFVWWSQAFSATVALGALVIKSPGSALAASSLTEIHIAAQVFEKAKDGFRIAKLLPSVRNLRERAQRTYDEYHSGRPLAHQQHDDVLPGINSSSTVVANAIFPKTTGHCLLTGTFSIQTNIVQSQPDAVDTLVGDYLRSLQSELDHLAHQRGITAEQPPNGFGDIDTTHAWQNMASFPSDSLLSSGLPQSADSGLQPDFDPAIWTDFMASFGAS